MHPNHLKVVFPRVLKHNTFSLAFRCSLNRTPSEVTLDDLAKRMVAESHPPGVASIMLPLFQICDPQLDIEAVIKSKCSRRY